MKNHTGGVGQYSPEAHAKAMAAAQATVSDARGAQGSPPNAPPPACPQTVLQTVYDRLRNTRDRLASLNGRLARVTERVFGPQGETGLDPSATVSGSLGVALHTEISAIEDEITRLFGRADQLDIIA